MEYSFSNITGDDNLVQEEAFDRAAAADCQIENNFSLKDAIEEITETRNGRTKTDIGDGQNSSVDETETVDDDNEGRVENPNALNDEWPICKLGYEVPLSEYKIRCVTVQVADHDECLVKTEKLPDTMQTADQDECLKNKHIFYYGGKDEWIQKFVKKATALANDLFLKDFDINIELYHVEEKARGEEHRVQKFWDHLKGCFSGKDKKQVEPLTKVIEKLLSDDPSGWAVLSRDSKNPITGDRETFLRVIEEFDQWKKNLVKNRFDLAFKNYYDNISLHVSTAAGK